MYYLLHFSTLPRRHLCQECGKHFCSRYSLTRHMVIHTNASKFLCEYCGVSFHTKDHLEGHKISKHQAEKRFKCEKCEKVFGYRKNLYHQNKNVCNKEETSMNTSCDTCQRKFKNKRTLKQHMRKHRAPQFNCHKCGKLFIWKTSLRVHLKNCGQ